MLATMDQIGDYKNKQETKLNDSAIVKFEVACIH